VTLRATTSQTVGPFFSIGFAERSHAELAGPGVEGTLVTIEGRVVDGDGKTVPDAVIEVWQANARGKYAHEEDGPANAGADGFSGFGRIPTDENGEFRFTTVKPGAVAAPDADGAAGKMQAPHIVVSVFMRGLLRRLVTRIYFPEDAALHAEDFALRRVEAGRRGTLVAKSAAGRAGVLEWNVVLQGPEETVFFDCGV